MKNNRIASAAFSFVINSFVALILILMVIFALKELCYEIPVGIVALFHVVMAAKNYAKLQTLKAKED